MLSSQVSLATLREEAERCFQNWPQGKSQSPGQLALSLFCICHLWFILSLQGLPFIFPPSTEFAVYHLNKAPPLFFIVLTKILEAVYFINKRDQGQGPRFDSTLMIAFLGHLPGWRAMVTASTKGRHHMTQREPEDWRSPQLLPRPRPFCPEAHQMPTLASLTSHPRHTEDQVPTHKHLEEQRKSKPQPISTFLACVPSQVLCSH